jgi:serine/threonine protein phosphatase PrpC
MSEPENKIYSSSITDRGLNERRPLNEDSYLDDNGRRIFAVADGVGGAEAGEIASQTAIEVLDEAFRHQVDGADIEDLMELAIQRANASIHRMAHENAKFSMMATTIVALHLKGNVATIGHVGDSRLYRLTPEGQLVRETEDHSIVEEEVRAGRLTPEQAANHPSKNVISRALGAEEGVEVDMKTIEVEDGTSFLLCSDGITRHVPDHELRGLLFQDSDLAWVCAELKKICYDRGAEDNLTAVVVRVGEAVARNTEEFERTLSIEFPSGSSADVVAHHDPVEDLDRTLDGLVPASRVVFPGASAPAEVQSQTPEEKPINIPGRHSRGGFARAIFRVFIFLLFIAAAAAAFYAGHRYRGSLPFGLGKSAVIPPVTQASPSTQEALLQFEKARREVDRAPGEWLANEVPKELTRRSITTPTDSPDPQFLYLYGRASLLSGNYEVALKAFEQAIARADQSPGDENATIKKDAALGLVAANLKTSRDPQRALTHLNEGVTKPANTNSP